MRKIIIIYSSLFLMAAVLITHLGYLVRVANYERELSVLKSQYEELEKKNELHQKRFEKDLSLQKLSDLATEEYEMQPIDNVEYIIIRDTKEKE